MDALPVQEDTGLPYASRTTAVDATGATVPVMHACGHDAHVTCALGAAGLLARNRAAWSGTYLALFHLNSTQRPARFLSTPTTPPPMCCTS